MVEGIRKERSIPERIARSLIQNEAQFIQSLEIFNNTSIVGGQGAQSGNASNGPGQLGNYLKKEGDIIEGAFAMRAKLIEIADNEIDITKIGENFTSYVILNAEGGMSNDSLNFIKGGSVNAIVTGAEFRGLQFLVLQGTVGEEYTINNDPSGNGDASAVPRFNIRTPDGLPFILKGNQQLILFYDQVTNQWAFPVSGAISEGGGTTQPKRVAKDLGDVTGGVFVDWSVAEFCRMRLIGDVTLTHLVGVPNGEWQQLTLEFLQDGPGQRNVVFLDGFANHIVPIVFKGGNRFTTIRFYAYKDNLTTRIFAFQDQDIDFFESFIQAAMSANQTANLSALDHVEFNLAIANDNTISVSDGSGQAKGVFTNFKKGHLYQCEAVVGIRGQGTSQARMAVRWFNKTTSQEFGSHASILTMNSDERESNGPVAKGFFVADDSSDEVEVRITFSSNVDRILPGGATTDPFSYVIIKDCGVAGIENLEFNIVDAAPPSTVPDIPVQFNARMVLPVVLSGTNPSIFTGSAGIAHLVWGRDNQNWEAPNQTNNREIKCLSPGVIRKITFKPNSNSFNKNIEFQLLEDGVVKGPVWFTMVQGSSAPLSFPTGKDSITSILLERGKSYVIRARSTDGVNPTGSCPLGGMIEVYFGNGLS